MHVRYHYAMLPLASLVGVFARSALIVQMSGVTPLVLSKDFRPASIDNGSTN